MSSSSGAVPDAVVLKAIALDAPTFPSNLQMHVTPDPDELSPADRANGATARFRVEWSGLAKNVDGTAHDINGTFRATGLASGSWMVGDLTVLTAGGDFATTGEDFSGTYEGTPGGWSYGPMRLSLKRDGASHTGTIVASAADGRAEQLRVLAFHRIRATDPLVQRWNGKLVMWVQDVKSADRSIELVDPSDLAQIDRGFLMRRLPRFGPLNARLERRAT
ncbi:MAG TPA: hypothetical protein VJZ76_03435 [Thermoanaerobaculia bacterium]|nr:hypothetical protein [Thermoanaerobaculia bacterium]